MRSRLSGRRLVGSWQTKHVHKAGIASHVGYFRCPPRSPATSSMTVQDIKNDYAANTRKSADELERRITSSRCSGRRMSDLTTSDVTDFTADRLKAGASAG